jgi:hypothetical protein
MRRSWRDATTKSTWTPRAPPPCSTVSGIPYVGAPLPTGPRGHRERHRHVRLSQVYMYLTLACRYQQVHVDTKSATAMFDCLRYTSYTMLARRYQQVHVDTKSATAMFNCLRYTLHRRTATTRSTWTPRAPTPCSTVSGIPLAPCWRAATNRSTWTPRAPLPCLTVSGIPLTLCWHAATKQVHVDTKSATAMFDCLRYSLHWRAATTKSTWTPRAPPPCSTVSGIPYIGAPLRPSPRGHQERHRHVRLSQVYCVPYTMI